MLRGKLIGDEIKPVTACVEKTPLYSTVAVWEIRCNGTLILEKQREHSGGRLHLPWLHNHLHVLLPFLCHRQQEMLQIGVQTKQQAAKDAAAREQLKTAGFWQCFVRS